MSGNRKKIEISSNALVDLKAEISRRKLTVNDSKYSKIHDPYSYKKLNPKIKKTEEQNKNVGNVSSSSYIPAELEKSRRIMEAKAKLYDALKQTAMEGKLKHEDSEDHECLVDFERLAREERKESSTKRIPPPSIYHSSKSRHSPSWSNSCSEDEEDGKYVKYKDLKSNFQKELDHVTYSHLRQGEIRTHGVGFYSFSEDAEKREQEMNKLNELHRAAEQARAKTIEEKSKRDAAMGSRLAKLRARKGLPDISTQVISVLEPENSMTEENNDVDIATMLRKMRDEAEERAIEKEAREIEEIGKRNSRIQEKTDNKSRTLAGFGSNNGYSYQPVSRHMKREWDIGKTQEGYPDLSVKRDKFY